MNFNPRNILIIDFGQLGDVILSLPALKAIREKFSDARITVLAGMANAQIIELSGFADQIEAVDRVKLRDSSKLWSIREILKLVAEIRRRKFDFIIDLHSLSETNLMAFMSGAKYRLLAQRESRSLDFLCNFSPKPPLEDKSKPLNERYLEALTPLGLEKSNSFIKIAPRLKELETVKKLLRDSNVEGEQLVGLFLGAGHPSRQWGLENFALVARNLVERENLRVVLFLGPEEKHLRERVMEHFPPETIIFDKLTLAELFAALSLLRVLVSNDTGPMHLAAIAGAAIVLILHESAPVTYLPLTKKLAIVNNAAIEKISVEDVLSATGKFLENG